jgi:hypothetical protein
MSHRFKPVTAADEIQVAILDQLERIGDLLELARGPEPGTATPEPTVVDEPTERPAVKKAVTKAAAKKTAAKRTRREVRGT